MKARVLKAVRLATLVLLALASLPVLGQDRFWVATTPGLWNNPANWSTASGGAGGASVPGASNTAIFDGNGTGDCNINVAASARGIELRTGYTGSVVQSAGVALTLGVGGYSQAAGTFSGGDAAIDINSGVFSLSGGSFTSTSGTLFIGGTQGASVVLVNFTGGTFAHNSGTIRLDPAFTPCGRRFATLALSSALTANHFIIDVSDAGCTEDALAITGSVLIVTGNLTHFNGFFDLGTIEVRGNFFLEPAADGGAGTILFNGPTDQEYSNNGSGRTAHIRVNKTTGVMGPSLAGIDLRAQQFTLDAGVFNAPTGVFRVGGVWTGNPTIFTVLGGTFGHNNGTVRLDPVFPECATRTATLNTPTAVTFFNLIVDVNDTGCFEDIFAVSGASSVIVANDFTQFDGFVNTGTVEVRGHVFLEAGADGGTATILMNGTGTQTYNNASAARFAHLRVNKASGVVNPGATTTDFQVQQFTLDAGVFNAPTGIFRVGGVWTGNPTIFTVLGGTFGHNNGTVRLDPVFPECATRTATLNTPTAVTFFNLIVDVNDTGCFEDIFAVSGASSVIVANDFTQFDGFVNTGTVEVRGNVFLEAGADGGTATILMNGTGTQTYNNASAARFAHLRVNKASGVVNPGATTTDFQVQQFTLDAGVFNAPTGVFRVGGSWTGNPTIFTVSGGTFGHNNGTVRLDPVFPECATRTATLSSSASVTFFNLIVDVNDTGCTEDNLAVTGAGSVVVANDFTQFDGFVNTGTVEVRGNVFLEAGADGGTATILMNGTGTQTYNNASAARFAHLRVNKASGVVDPGATTTDFQVQQFTLDAGVFNAPTGIFRVGGVWTGNPTIFTVLGGTFGHNNGTVRLDPVFPECATRTATLNTPTAVTFFNLIVDVNDTGCFEDIFAVSGASSVIVANDFTQFDGFVNTGTVEVRGNVFLEAGADGGTATILMNGTGTQTYNNASTARFAHLRVNKASGVVNPGATTTDFQVQQFTLDAGVFNAPTGVFRVGGSWTGNPTIFTVSGGTFGHNNGTVRLDPVFPECAVRTATMHIPAGITFHDLIVVVDDVGCSEDILNITGASSFVTLNTLTLLDGSVNGATMDVRSHVTVSAGFDGGNAPLLFSGFTPQNFDLTGATANFNANVIINKSAASVTLLSTCQLDAPSQSITFTSGLLNTTLTNLLIIGDNVTVSGGSAASHVNGPVRKIGNDAFTFPTGKSGIYSPVAISAPGVITDAFTGEYFAQNATTAGFDIALRDISLADISGCDYWILSRTTGTSNIFVTLTWNTATGCGGFDTNVLAVARWNGTQWTNAGATASTSSGSTGTITSALVSSFSPFAVASTSGPLPVELVSFTARWLGGPVRLEWQTASERDNDYFDVERSASGTNFETLGRVQGAGQSNVIRNYAYNDEAPLQGLQYYRLKQVDFDGAFSYSPVVSVMVQDGAVRGSAFTVHPNPVGGQFVFFNRPADVTVINADSRVVASGLRVSSLDVSALPAGVYLVRNESGEVARFVVIR